MNLAFLKNWPFAIKFAIAPIFALLGIVLMVSLAVSALSGSNATMERVIENGLGASLEVGSIGRDFKSAEARLYRFMTAVASGERTADAAEMEAIAAEIGAVEQRLAALTDTPLGQSMGEALTRVAGELASYREAIAVVGTMLEIDFASAASLLAPFGELGDRVSKTVEDMIAAGALSARSDAGVAQADASATLRNILFIAFIGILTLAGASFVIGRDTVSGTRTIADATSRVAAGDDTVDIDGLTRRDELGSIAAALSTFRTAQRDAERLRSEREQAEKREALDAEERRNEAKRREAEERDREVDRQKRAVEERRQLAENFDRTISGLMQTLDRQAKSVEASAKGMKTRAGENASWSLELSESSNAVLENIQLISAAAEQMRASIDEISGQVQQSSSNVGQAVTATEETATAVTSLADSVQQIGQIVALINDIADQTNLLALNATIEAARAGEAGKGFAVVASEVKSLAAQTAKATNDIGQRINEVQTQTRSVVERIAQTKTLIGHAEESSAAIASAVEEQAAATQEIARTVEIASQDTGRFSERVERMSAAANQNGSAAEALLAVITDLGKDFRSLEEAAQGFADKIRA